MVLATAGLGQAATLPTGFVDEVVIGGLSTPTNVEFASDGRVFVSEKSGRIQVYDSLADPSPTLFADLSTNTYNFWDRGMLGLELHPDFPATPYVYVLYAHDAAIGASAPRWGTPGVLSDPCPSPPGATSDGCLVSGRLSQLEAAGNVMTGAEQVLVEDFCQQYPSHSIGDIVFGRDGALYASAGDGASFNFVDYGQDGNPRNPCGDPPVPVGGTQTAPNAEGGALRSQDLRTPADPTSLDGTIVRLDPLTGLGVADNPLASSPDPNARRIIAYGLRNPFRIAHRPGTDEIWVGDVGWRTWEEINRIASPAAPVDNFGWPCYEGAGRQSGYDSADLTICENLYTSGSHQQPFFTYRHSDRVVSGESCPTGSSSPAGIAFYESGGYPSVYDGALFFADYSRACIWAMFTDVSGEPDPGTRITFVAGASGPVDLEIGPAGDLFYVDIAGGAIHRVRYLSSNRRPVAVAAATPTSGSAPLTVDFDGTGSSDPDPGDTLTYAWDLDGDGLFDDSTSSTPSLTYTNPGSVTVGLQVTDSYGERSVDTVVVSADNTPPVATIEAPTSLTTWAVGSFVAFSGSALDEQEGFLGSASFEWSLILHHCPSNCHEHTVQDFTAVTSGAFSAPDHEHPSHLELRLTVTDSAGLQGTASVILQPRTVVMTFDSDPFGAAVTVDADTQTAPFERTVIEGSEHTIGVPTPQTLAGIAYQFESWSNGGGQTHQVTAATSSTYSAALAKLDGAPPEGQVLDPGQNLRGVVTLEATATDADGAVVSVLFQRSRAEETVWVNLGTPITAPPFEATLNTSALADGLYDFRVQMTDDSGNVATSAPVRVRIDNTPPSGTLERPTAWWALTGTVALAAGAADSGSGVSSVVFELRVPDGAYAELAAGAFDGTRYTTSWDTSTQARGNYELRVTITDGTGNSISTASIGVTVADPASPLPPAPPTGSSSAGQADGGTSSGVAAGATGVDPGSCTMFGTPGNDVLIGTDDDDVICGLEGHDVIRGLDGDDILDGGPGQDRLIGGSGKDRLIGGSGSDRARGGPGSDLLHGRSGRDKLRGGAGADLINGGSGPDVLRGGSGRDVMRGGRGADLFYARDRTTDRIGGGRGRDVGFVDAGRDRVRGLEARR